MFHSTLCQREFHCVLPPLMPYLSRAHPHNARSLCLLGRTIVFANKFCGDKYSPPDFRHMSERSWPFVFVLSWLAMPVDCHKHNLLSQTLRFTKKHPSFYRGFGMCSENRRSGNGVAYCVGREYVAIRTVLQLFRFWQAFGAWANGLIFCKP